MHSEKKLYGLDFMAALILIYLRSLKTCWINLPLREAETLGLEQGSNPKASHALKSQQFMQTSLVLQRTNTI
jgi:hypothetical protein